MSVYPVAVFRNGGGGGSSPLAPLPSSSCGCSSGFSGFGLACAAPSFALRTGGCCLKAADSTTGKQQCCGPAFTYQKVEKRGDKYRIVCGTKTGPGGGTPSSTDTLPIDTASMFPDLSGIFSGPYLTYGLYALGGYVAFKVIKSVVSKKGVTHGKRRS